MPVEINNKLYDRVKEYYDKNKGELVQKANAMIVKRKAYNIEPEDVVQETFYRLLRWGTPFLNDNVKTLDAWVYAVMRNTFRQLLHGNTISSTDEIPEYEEEVGKDELLRRMVFKDAIDKMDEKQTIISTALRAYYIFGYPRREIIAALGIKRKTLNTWLDRFKNQMKERYS